MDLASQLRQATALGGAVGIAGQCAPLAQPSPQFIAPQFIAPQAVAPQVITPQVIAPFVVPQVQTVPLQQAVLTPMALTLSGIDASQTIGAISNLNNFNTLQAISNLQTSRALIDLAMRALQPAAALRVVASN